MYKAQEYQKLNANSSKKINIASPEPGLPKSPGEDGEDNMLEDMLNMTMEIKRQKDAAKILKKKEVKRVEQLNTAIKPFTFYPV